MREPAGDNDDPQCDGAEQSGSATLTESESNPGLLHLLGIA
jgi:hypothetical protein